MEIAAGQPLAEGIGALRGQSRAKLGEIEERKAEFAVLSTSLRVSHEIIPQDRFAERL